LGGDDVAGLPNNVGTVNALVESGTVKRKVEAAIAKATKELEFLVMIGLRAKKFPQGRSKLWLGCLISRSVSDPGTVCHRCFVGSRPGFFANSQNNEK
jgi:hypothetical protein